MTVTSEMAELTYVEAIRQAQEDAMAEDETIILLGQDIVAGFPFGATRGLAELYGTERVRNTPLSEAATMGCGVGVAMMGRRTVVEVDFAGFLFLGLDQLINNAAKLRYMSGGQIRVPLVVRVGQGPLGSFAAQHSQSPQGWLANTPGLALSAPSNPQDAYDLLRWALRQDDPVVFAEDMRLYRTKGSFQPGDDLSQPRAAVARKGADATAICFGYGTRIALEAADALAGEGIELEVLDLRQLSPLDEAAIAKSVRRTGRALCIADDPLLGGICGSLAATATELAYNELRAPVLRLGARHVPVPYAAELERRVYPSPGSIAESVRKLVGWEG